MKIEKKEEPSKSVTITLETQEELDFFTSVFYNVGGGAAIDVFGGTSYIVRHLESLGGYAERYISIGGDGLDLKEREN